MTWGLRSPFLRSSKHVLENEMSSSWFGTHFPLKHWKKGTTGSICIQMYTQECNMMQYDSSKRHWLFPVYSNRDPQSRLTWRGRFKKTACSMTFCVCCVVWRWSTTNCASSNGLKTWVPVQAVRRRCLTAMKAVSSMVNSCFHLLLSFSYTRNISQFMLCYMSEQPDQSKVAFFWMPFVWFASSTCFRRWKQRWCVFAQNTWSLGLGIIQNTSCKESWLSIFCITFILRLQPFLVLHVYGWWPLWWIHGKNMFSVDIEDLSQLCSNGSRHWLQAQGDLPGAMNQ